MASGINKLKKAALRGMITMNTMAVACMVNIWLNTSGDTNVDSAVANWARITPASTPATRNTINAVMPYRTPIRLWSTV